MQFMQIGNNVLLPVNVKTNKRDVIGLFIQPLDFYWVGVFFFVMLIKLGCHVHVFDCCFIELLIWLADWLALVSVKVAFDWPRLDSISLWLASFFAEFHFDWHRFGGVLDLDWPYSAPFHFDWPFFCARLIWCTVIDLVSPQLDPLLGRDWPFLTFTGLCLTWATATRWSTDW